MNRFIEKVTLGKLDGTFIKSLNQIEKTHLLILDDFGLQQLNADNRLALLQLLEIATSGDRLSLPCNFQ